MTRDDIVRMAEQAGAHHLANAPGFTDFLTRFAALLREKMIADGWRQCAQGQKTTQFCDVAEQARQEEREACARACETQWSTGEERAAGLLFAAEIRARGQA